MYSLIVAAFVTYQNQTGCGEGPKEFRVLIWGGGALGILLLLTPYLRCKCRKDNEEISGLLCCFLSGFRRMTLMSHLMSQGVIPFWGASWGGDTLRYGRFLCLQNYIPVKL